MKRLLVTVLVVCCALSLWSLGFPPLARDQKPAYSAPEAVASPELTIIAVGDSITAGTASPFSFVHFLPAYGEVAVHNEGVPSDTTGKMLARFDRALSEEGEIVLIFGGTNDVYYSVNRRETMDNIGAMVKKARSAGKQPVLVGPLPRNDVSTGDLASLREEIRRYASNLEVAFIDPWPAFEDTKHLGWIRPVLTSDGVHPNEIGAALLANQVANGLHWERLAGSQ